MFGSVAIKRAGQLSVFYGLMPRCSIALDNGDDEDVDYSKAICKQSELPQSDAVQHSICA